MIKINRLDKYFNRGKNSEVHAINDVSAILPDSGMVAFFGPSGCGKTTLLNVIGGLDKARTGTVEIDGKTINPKSIEERNKDIGYIFQSYNLSKNLTVYENVATALKLCGVRDADEIDRRVMAALKSVDMEKFRKRLPENLSGGQQQRVAIARAIVKNPKVILADEPTGNLDENNTVKVMNILKEISKEHLVLLVTHEADLVDIYCDKVVELKDGKIINEHENENTGKYQGKGKNDIYLGDMDKYETEGEGVDIEYFGQKDNMPGKIRLICVGNTIYLKAEDGVRIRVVDNSTEYRFHEGKFEHSKEPESEHLAPELKEKVVSAKKPGKMYTLMYAVKAGISNNFGKKKFGRKVLTFALVMLSLIMVITAGSLGTVIENIQNVRNYYNSSSIVVSTSSMNDRNVYDEINELSSEYGINCIYLAELYRYDSSQKLNTDSISCDLMISSFNGIRYIPNIGNASTFVLPVCAMNTSKILKGKSMPDRDNEIVLSQALADKILDKVEIDSINDYEDLLYMDCRVQSSKFTIVGIVKDKDNAAYVTNTAFAAIKVSNEIGTESQYGNTGLPELKDGEVYLFQKNNGIGNTSKVGDKIDLHGKTFVVKGIINSVESSKDEYSEWIKHGRYSYLASFKSYLTWQGWEPSTFDSYDNYEKAQFGDALESLEKFREWYGAAATEEDLNNMRRMAANDFRTLKEDLTNEYTREYEDTYKVYLDSLQPYTYLITESDFMELTHTKYGNKDSRDYIVHAQKADELGKALEEKFGAENVTTIYEQYNYYSEALGSDAFGYIRVMIIMLVAMAVFMFFIMRSNLMKDIREVGINCAIGVKRSNIVFRYYIESVIVFVRSVLPGFIFGSLIVTMLSGIPIDNLVYYPWYSALAVFILLFAVTTLCGIIPVCLLLRKTPAQIISKYDI